MDFCVDFSLSALKLQDDRGMINIIIKRIIAINRLAYFLNVVFIIVLHEKVLDKKRDDYALRTENVSLDLTLLSYDFIISSCYGIVNPKEVIILAVMR